MLSVVRQHRLRTDLEPRLLTMVFCKIDVVLDPKYLKFNFAHIPTLAPKPLTLSLFCAQTSRALAFCHRQVEATPVPTLRHHQEHLRLLPRGT